MIFRQPEPTDMPLIRDSFWRAVMNTVPAARGVPRSFLVSMLDRCMTSPAWKVVILCPDPETPDEIGGWAVWRSPTEILWVCVKPRYHGLGLGHALMEHIGAGPGPIFAPLVPSNLAARARAKGFQVHARPYLPLE